MPDIGCLWRGRGIRDRPVDFDDSPVIIAIVANTNRTENVFHATGDESAFAQLAITVAGRYHQFLGGILSGILYRESRQVYSQFGIILCQRYHS
jgi:hypothetical protein